MSQRIVVIGAGLGGLAVAARLAVAGHDVTVIEQAAQVGGKLGTRRLDSPVGPFTFDTGPSLLTWPEVFTDLWDAIDLPAARRPTLRRLLPIVDYRFADGTGNEAFDQTLWQSVLAEAAAMWRLGRDRFVRQPLTLASIAHQLRALPQLRRLHPAMSLKRFAQRHTTDERLRLVLQRYATYAGADPARAPAALAMIAGLEDQHGGWYVEGGLHTIASVLRHRLTELGAQLRLGTAVDTIERRHGRRGAVTGVRLANGERLSADTVVAGCDPTVLRRLLGRRAARPSPGLGGFVLLLGMRGRTPGLAHHTVVFPANYRDEFDAIFASPPRLPREPTLYISAPDDPSAQPADHEGWFVLVNVAAHDPSGKHGVDWTDPKRVEAMTTLVYDQLASRGLDVRDRVAVSQVLTPADLQSSAGAPGGRIYARPAHGPFGALHPPARTGVRGLYRVGGGAHPGGGLPLVALSARYAADAIMKRRAP